jgi:hypothetical protein
MKKEHKKIIELIEKYLENQPDLRFGQALFNLKVNEFQETIDDRNPNFDLRDIYNDSDEEIIERIQKQLDWFDSQKRE